MGADGLLGGRYRLDRVIGHGGMATVFAADDVVLKRTVAVKLLQRRHDETGVLYARFQREALAEARIVHPNVVTVHDIGEHEDGRPYIVMDFVDGRSLAAVLDEGPLSSERTAVIGIGVARALAAAHGLGIIHRDVKPANILIDEQGTPHLTDFGLARARGLEDLELTAPGVLLGSAYYIAPEQARHGAATPACDLYAFGAVLYHAIAGAPPFGGNGAIDVTLRRFEEVPAPLSARVAGVDEQLAALVHGLLAVDPATRRPQSAEAVVEALSDIAARLRVGRTGADDGAPVLVPPPPPVVAASACPNIAPHVPPPNSSPLPSSHWTPEEPAS
ncbi:MAG TPA: serine/threonine-protein kinase [Candidatus Acidoferrum sp.]|nr:serine/threonine-protein kinase [Candidatus Acidoferrum sp.]